MIKQDQSCRSSVAFTEQGVTSLRSQSSSKILLITEARKLQLIAGIPQTEEKIKAMHTMHSASRLVLQLDIAIHHGGDVELYLTIPIASTGATPCESSLGL